MNIVEVVKDKNGRHKARASSRAPTFLLLPLFPPSRRAHFMSLS